jgi:hypothetical protein
MTTLSLQSSSINDESPDFSSKTIKRLDDATIKKYVKRKLPIEDAYEHLLTYLREVYVLRKEIPIDKLSKFTDSLYENPSPGVFEVFFDNSIKINWDKLAKHPYAFTKKYQLENIIKLGVSSEFWLSLCENTNPNVIEFIKEKIAKEKKEYKTDYETKRTFKRDHYIKLAKNPTPGAIKLVEERIKDNDKVNNDLPKLKKVAIDENKDLLKYLCTNPTTEAIELFKSNRLAMFLLSYKDDMSYILWTNLFANPYAMKIIEECRWEDWADDWDYLQKNPNPKAFTLLSKKRLGNIIYNYSYLSENPSSKAIKILQEKMEQENSLSKEEYYNLMEGGLSKGLNWIKISKNPKAMSLILAKIEQEKDREKEIKEDFKNNNSQRNLNWQFVLTNPNIFKRTRKKKDEEKAKKIELYLHPLPIK